MDFAAWLFLADKKLSHSFNIRADSLIKVIFSVFDDTADDFVAINVKSDILIHTSLEAPVS
jgi:hypothetical protein